MRHLRNAIDSLCTLHASDTARPANSINWSIEKPPTLVSSLSSAEALAALKVSWTPL